MFARLVRLRIGQIDAHHRRGLSESVAFENFFVEAFLKMAGKIERQFLRADNYETQALELLQLGFTQVQTQECGRRQQKGQLVPFDQRCALGRFQRIRVRDDADTFNERIPKCDSRSEGVKEGQRSEDCVGLSCVEQLPELRHVSDDVAVADDHTFRFSSRSACKEQDCLAVAALLRNS